MAQGMVLTIAIWADPKSNMNWLESCDTHRQYDCKKNSKFTSTDVWRDAPPGTWRGPVDHYTNFSASFGNGTLSHSYPGIPPWSRFQSQLTCPRSGSSPK